MYDHTYVYLHGFSSSPESNKAVILKEHFKNKNIDLLIPDLTDGDFSSLSLSKALNILESIIPENNTLRIIGSSFGGLTAALYASLHPEKIDSLILLAPAFNLKMHFERLLGERNIKKWKSNGFFRFQNYRGKLTPVSWNFMSDLTKYPDEPLFSCTAKIIHGSDDDLIPLSSSEKYVKSRNNIKLFEVKDDHSLAKSIEVIKDIIDNLWF